jgi:hypothetical protein
VATRAEVVENHARLLREYQHVRFMWIPYTNDVVVVRLHSHSFYTRCEASSLTPPPISLESHPNLPQRTLFSVLVRSPRWAPTRWAPTRMRTNSSSPSSRSLSSTRWRRYVICSRRYEHHQKNDGGCHKSDKRALGALTRQEGDPTTPSDA